MTDKSVWYVLQRQERQHPELFGWVDRGGTEYSSVEDARYARSRESGRFYVWRIVKRTEEVVGEEEDK
jgi:hypothetical protein